MLMVLGMMIISFECVSWDISTTLEVATSVLFDYWQDVWLFTGLCNYYLMTSAEQLWLKNVLNYSNKTDTFFLIFCFIFHVLLISVIIFQLTDFHLFLGFNIKVHVPRKYFVKPRAASARLAFSFPKIFCNCWESLKVTLGEIFPK